MMRAIISRKLLGSFSTEATKVSLPELKYSYSALEPVISSKLLETHHKKHHQTYVNNLNAALDQFEGTLAISQKPKRILITTNWLDSAKLSSLTWVDISTTLSIGKILLQLAREEVNTPLKTLFSLNKSTSSSEAMILSLKNLLKRPYQSKVLDGDGLPLITLPAH